MSRQFSRKVENFICENCGEEVKGNGYTNHCPNCLFSKHVDINPGDRKSKCHGLMKPVLVEADTKKAGLLLSNVKNVDLKREIKSLNMITLII